MSVFADFFRALGQLGDRTFRGVLFLGLGLTILLLLAFYALLGIALQIYLPETVTLPLFGEVGFLDDLLTGVALFSVMFLSVFLMVPVAAAFTGVFLDRIVDAVEARHYPLAGPSTAAGFRDTLKESVNFLGIVIAANFFAMFLYLVAGPLSPFIFYGLNGFLLGREYFQVVAMRRLGRDGAKKLRRQHGAAIWFAGTLMALPLSIPLINLIIPILGVATFTHMFHRLHARD